MLPFWSVKTARLWPVALRLPLINCCCPFHDRPWDQCPIEDAMARWYKLVHGWCGWEKAFQKVKDCVDGAGNRGLGHPIDRGDHTLWEIFYSSSRPKRIPGY